MLLFADAPGPPGQPQVVDWDSDHVDITWTPPQRDGGAPISGFIVQKKDKYTFDFSNVFEIPGDQMKASVPNLPENKEFQFRVVAVNKAGPGEPSEASRTVITKPRYGKSMWQHSRVPSC